MAKEKKKTKKRFRIWKVIGLTFLLMISSVVGGGVGYLKYLQSTMNQSIGEETFDKKKIVKNKGVQEKEEYWTVALFGLDARDATLGKGNRSDSIMIATLNKATKEVILTSIYRDSFVEIPGYGYDKLTHAYAFGGPELAINTLNYNFDLDIQDYITVNFAVTEKIINQLGGVEVDVKSDEVKWLNGYVRSLAREGADTRVEFIDGPGRQVLTGSQAVAYARIRYTDGGDYKRAKRQRTILNATFEKAKDADLLQLNDIIKTMFAHINTNLSMQDILLLVKDINKYVIKDSQGFPYHTKNARVNTCSYTEQKIAVDIPTMLAEDLKTLHYHLYGVGSPSTVKGLSDSYLGEDNGIANKGNGGEEEERLEGTTTEVVGEETTEEEVPSTTETVDVPVDPDKQYTPSADVQRISDYLSSQVEYLGY